MSILVIVESPAKAKTIQKYLGAGYEVVASMGHIRDLPKTLLGVDVEHGFKPHYVDISGKSALIRSLREKAAQSDAVILATDPDREGEAISWHLAKLFDQPLSANNRVTFNEITKTGVQQGMSQPRCLDMDLVNAQQARRILDRLVGYKLSPFLWKKIRKGLSAGRVQSAAVGIVVDREEAIRSFVSEEYWTLDAQLESHEKPFTAKFYGLNGEKTALTCREQTDALAQRLCHTDFVVTEVKKGVRRVSPTPPFITSTLQQEANRKLGFSSRRTMQTAQALYEGVEVEGLGAVGLITYMRTDSLRVSEEARTAARAYITNHYGAAYLPEKPRTFSSRSNAQDAHEAIRPSMPALTPDQVKSSLTSDQYRLYRLIWERFIASQMANCVQDTCQITVTADDAAFKASGYQVKFDGFTVLYVESKDGEDEKNPVLPPLKTGDVLRLLELVPAQHFTQPPPRFTEATLIRELEENGIGRPSTYAPTIGTILAREYVEMDGKSIRPTALGEVTTRLMKQEFPQIVDTEFTAQMEKKLDGVESGRADWVQTLDTFYRDFAQTLTEAEKKLSDERIAVPEAESDVVCEKCGSRMVIKTGRYGKFLACPHYPQCQNTKRLVKDTGGICPKCGGAILAKKSKNKRTFYGCENYPKCDFVSWYEPAGTLCPVCGKTLFRKKGKGTVCLTEHCPGKLPEKEA